MGAEQDDSHIVHLSLTDNNKTIRGFVNFTGFRAALEEEEEAYDSKGAATFVIAVIMVYGLSIVLMIASLAKQNMKIKDLEAEEKQIHRYLNQASDLREKGAKDNYRQLKKNIISIVNKTPLESKAKKADLNHNQDFKAKAISSLMAVGSPTAAEVTRAKEASVEVTSELQLPDDGRGLGRNRKYSQPESLQPLLEEDESTDAADGAEGGSQPGDPVDNTTRNVKTQRQDESKVIEAKDGIQVEPTGDTPSRQSHSGHALVPIVIISNKNGSESGRDTHSLRPLDSSQSPDSTRESQDAPQDCKVDIHPTPENKTTRRTSSGTKPWLLPTPIPTHPSLTPSSSVSSPGSISYELLKDHSPSTPSGSAVPFLLPAPGSQGTHRNSPGSTRFPFPGYPLTAAPSRSTPSPYDPEIRPSSNKVEGTPEREAEDLLGDLPDDCLSAHDLHRLLLMSEGPRESSHVDHVDEDEIQISTV